MVDFVAIIAASCPEGESLKGSSGWGLTGEGWRATSGFGLRQFLGTTGGTTTAAASKTAEVGSEIADQVHFAVRAEEVERTIEGTTFAVGLAGLA